MKLIIKTLVILVFMPMLCLSQIRFEDSFEVDLTGWEINNDESVKIIDSQDPGHGNVLVLIPNGNVSALIKNSDQWGSLRIEGTMLFPTKEDNYLGFIYNYQKQVNREDFGLLYVKGNGSYIRANPWRDGNVSRLLYEEYKTKLEEDQAVKIGVWHTFKMEVVNEICHLYINDMELPKVTFGLFEFESGKIGFQPRVTGGEVWIDNIKVTPIKEFSYKGENIPNIVYEPDSLITRWEVLGPFNKPNTLIERTLNYNEFSIEINGRSYAWETFKTDLRGGVITGRVTEYEGENTVAYFRTFFDADYDKTVTLHFTSTDELALFVNGKDFGRVYRDGYFYKDNDWNAWYDFWKNPQHSGSQVKIPLKKGKNQLIIRVRNGQFASGGFFVYEVP